MPEFETRLDCSGSVRTSLEKYFLSDLLSSIQGVLLHLESEKSQWLFPEVEWSFYSLHTQRINWCYNISSCPAQRGLGTQQKLSFCSSLHAQRTAPGDSGVNNTSAASSMAQWDREELHAV